tara:strand:- start:5988 stop:6419 length:432 start_codon:yes stop_codon:yes gene_type:complete
MNSKVSSEDLKALFNKPYGVTAPTKNKWAQFYDQNVIFEDPIQAKIGLDEYIDAQNKLVERCDDIFLETKGIVITESIGFIEWTMGLKIMGREFIYPGTTRLIFGENGKIINHRDYFDFCGPTFGPVPILGLIIRWIYKRFTN